MIKYCICLLTYHVTIKKTEYLWTCEHLNEPLDINLKSYIWEKSSGKNYN